MRKCLMLFVSKLFVPIVGAGVLVILENSAGSNKKKFGG